MTEQRVIRLSYIFVFCILLAVVWFKLATPLLTVLFSYLFLSLLRIRNINWIATVLFLLLVFGIFYGFVYFTSEAITAIPKIIEKAIPATIDLANKYEIEIPFDDVESLRAVSVEGVKTQLGKLAKFAEVATFEFIFLIIGIIVGISLFYSTKLDLNQDSYHIKNNLYTHLTNRISERFKYIFESFRTVMGAQLVISSINTFFTAIFIYIIALPYYYIIIVVTFFCGLLPIIGNLISNTIIIGIAITESPTLAIASLVYLVVLHKLEYFLNSKIIGDRIKNPMWLTLLSLIVGERVMGIPGMILAPVILHYIKVECSQIEVHESKI